MACSTILVGRVARILTAPDFGQPARITAMTAVKLLLLFAAGEPHLFGIDDDHMIAGVQERRISRLMFAHQNQRSFTRDASQNLAIGIDNMPLAHDFALAGNRGFHKDRPSPFKTYSRFSLPNWAVECQTGAVNRLFGLSVVRLLPIERDQVQRGRVVAHGSQETRYLAAMVGAVIHYVQQDLP